VAHPAVREPAVLGPVVLVVVIKNIRERKVVRVRQDVFKVVEGYRVQRGDTGAAATLETPGIKRVPIRPRQVRAYEAVIKEDEDGVDRGHTS